MGGIHLSASIAKATERREEGRQYRVCDCQAIFCLLFTLGSGDGWMLTLINAGMTELLLQMGLELNSSSFFFAVGHYRDTEQEESRMWYCVHVICERLFAGITEALR